MPRLATILVSTSLTPPSARRCRSTPQRYDGAADSTLFLLAYEEAVLEAGGDNKIMANLFPLALAGEPRVVVLTLTVM